MAVYRVDLVCNDHLPVFQWLEENFEKNQIVRRIGYKVRAGWYLKVVFKKQDDAELFHRQYFPDADDHRVKEFGQ